MASPPKGPTDIEYLRKRAASMSGVNRVVVLAVDSCDHSKYAFDWFLDNIYRSDDMIILAHIPEIPKLPTFKLKSGLAPPIHEWKRALDDMNHRATKLEEEFEAILIQKKFKYKFVIESNKHAGEGICDVADSENADIICVGTHGHNVFRRALLGSVSEYVIRNSHRPTIVIPIGKDG